MGYEVPLQGGPVRCPYCNEEARYVDSTEIYGPEASPGNFYICGNSPQCDARVEAAGEKRPIGTLARFELRVLRRTCHHYFDVLWCGKDAPMSRTEAYEYLHKFLRSIDPARDHIGCFDEERCQDFLARWDCKTCREMADRGENFGPSHYGSRNCRSGAIAAGGHRTHCACDTCF